MSESQRLPGGPDEEIGAEAAASLSGVSATAFAAARESGELRATGGDLRRRDVAAWGERLRRRALGTSATPHVREIVDAGFTHIRGALQPAAAQELRSECAEALARTHNGDRHREYAQSDREVLDRIVRLHELIPRVCDRLFRASSVTSVLDEIFDGGYGIYGVSLVISDPGLGRGMALHRDPTWTTRRTADPVLAAGLHLDPATAANGAVGFFPGSHLEAGPSAVAAGEVVPETCGGDVVIHNLGVWHRSGANRSDISRRVVYFALMSCRESEVSGRPIAAGRGQVAGSSA